ncbi:two-component system sensor histidine kinase/response regulator [Massilia sp. Root418]|jgi:CheY-like chemotaxis protein|uniref:ATP-binding response regulator n=1 Tax=Massilia sp. Root418 TaxID=1736532 RepID=UPI0006F4E3D1|nr:response regulator [Massilia sp. Root418]KQW87046.1 two-component system sensor histidine kinase/response regulator [Massilia sp. Root418]
MAQVLKVLVVDDVETMRKVTAGQLASLGYGPIDMAGDGAEAWRMLERKRYDLVISDWNMPAMTGIALLQQMRASPRHIHTPFIMITAEAERTRIEAAIASGVSDLLVKPYTAGRLATSVQRAISHRAPEPAPGAQSAAMPAPPHAAAAGPVHLPPLAPPPPTLLLVDDTADNLHVLANVFKGVYRIKAAHNGEKALALCCSDTPPDLVLLDVMMPDMDGFEVARRMRQHPNAENVPIIFVTALTSDAARTEGMTLGAVDFVTKPIDPFQLKLRVANFMRYVELRRQLQADYDNMLAMARLRDDVEAMTRHDLKGPLAGAIGILQALIDAGDLDRRQGEQLRLAEQAMLQVTDMVNLSTELYKIETGKYLLRPEPLPISDVLRRVVETARASYAGKQLVIAVDTDFDVGTDPPVGLGDAMLTYSLLNNLIKNACEAAPERSRVSATLYAGSPLRIEIINKSVIPEQIRPRFFDKFVTGGRAGGTGLGTYSARLLARAQHGDVAFAVDDEAQTTTLIVTLPAAPPVLPA